MVVIDGPMQFLALRVVVPVLCSEHGEDRMFNREHESPPWYKVVINFTTDGIESFYIVERIRRLESLGFTVTISAPNAS
ncbi:hypothetical protein SAMN04487897_1525 [Paenibacillus sp. yr247]|nr:hypothetical protein SAMN04487897_1525 [Paenibacillus sp. yr247]